MEVIDGLIEEVGKWRFHYNLLNKLTLQGRRKSGHFCVQRTFERCDGCSDYKVCRLQCWKPLLPNKLGFWSSKYSLRDKV